MERIASYLQGWSERAFMDDLRTMDAVCMNLIRIGESARLLSPTAKAQAGHVPWPKIITMRNWIAHTYAQVDFDVIWRTATVSVPALRDDLLKLQADLSG